MMTPITQSLLIMGLAIWLQWRELQSATKGTRWTAYAFYLLAAGLWVYIATVIRVPRPTTLLENVLGPWIPFP